MMKIMPVDQFRPEDFKTPPIQAGNEIETIVDEIIANVRQNGDQALKEYAAKFDKAELNSAKFGRHPTGVPPFFYESWTQNPKKVVFLRKYFVFD